MSPTAELPSRRPSPFLSCWILALLAASSAGVSASELGDPYLVRDIETTGEPFYAQCPIGCPEAPLFGALVEQLTPFGERIVFVANDRVHGFEPWVSDGTAERTWLLADTCAGACDGSTPTLVGVLEDRLYSWSEAPGSGGGNLWTTDGTPEGTRSLDELCPELCGGLYGGGESVVFGGFLFFQLYDQLPGDGFQLWRTDGTPEGTARVPTACSLGGACFTPVTSFFTYRGRLFFTDDAGLRRLDDPESQPAVAWSERPTSAAPLGARMILAAGSSLWSMAGPLSTPRSFADVGSGASISQLTSAGDHVYFVREEDQWAELWRTDGTAAGTDRVGGYAIGRTVDLVGVLGAGPIVLVDPDPGSLPVILPTLWRVKPDTSAEALSYGAVRSVAVVGGRVFFSGGGAVSRPDAGVVGRELWVSDGTGEGTRLVADIAPGPASSDPGFGGLRTPGFARAGDLLFFPAFHPDVDVELWALDLKLEGEPPPPPSPPPPGVQWLESPEVPGFRVQVRISGGGASILGREEPVCIAETLCVSGAIPGRSEVFVRVVGPKPNGFLWPTLVKFSTSTVEVWIEQEATEVVRYYFLEGASPGFDELPGLFDRMGFRP